MTDLYPTLLREVDKYTFGVTLQNIIPLIKRGNEMRTKRLVMVIDGMEYNAIEYESLGFQFENNTVIINVKTENQDATEEVVEIKKDVPTPEGFIAMDATAHQYQLTGDDLDAFNSLSSFRISENVTKEIEGKIKVDVIIESDVYDIQDMMSVNTAILDLSHKEDQFIATGYKVFNASVPTYSYIDSDNFKLVENVVLYDFKDK